MHNPKFPDILSTYGVTPLLGTEDLGTIQHTKASAITYLKECAKKKFGADTQVAYPDDWKHLLKQWTAYPSEPRELLERTKLEDDTPTAFFDELAARVTVRSKVYSTSFRDLLFKLTQPASMEVHHREMYDYYLEFYTERIEPKFLETLRVTYSTPELTSNAWFNTEPGLVVKQEITQKLEQCIEIANIANKKLFLDKSMSAGIMGILASDVTLYDCFESTAVPLELSSDRLTSMVQEKILRPKHCAISLKLVKGQSPLHSLPPVQRLNAQQQQQQQQQQLHNQPATVTTGAGNRGGGPIPSKRQRPGNNINQPTNTNPQGVKKVKTNNGAKNTTRRCTYCYQFFPNSTNKDKHDQPFCKRDPNSPAYDAIFAAKPVK